MRNEMKRSFQRAGKVTVCVGEKVYKRRGIVLAVDRTAKVFTSFELLRCGRLETPLYRYLGDAEELLGVEEAVLSAEGAAYRVLHAEPVTGFSGQMYIQAILERQVQEHDGE